MPTINGNKITFEREELSAKLDGILAKFWDYKNAGATEGMEIRNIPRLHICDFKSEKVYDDVYAHIEGIMFYERHDIPTFLVALKSGEGQPIFKLHLLAVRLSDAYRRFNLRLDEEETALLDSFLADMAK